MSTAFTFPGQGSQSVGMGKDLADAFPAARAVFEEIDDALDQKLSALMWEGPEDELTLTANAQPALMAVSMAAMRALEAGGFSLKDKVAYVAGHSLGEYSALAAAGALTVGDTARLLRIRGNAMQQAVPVGKGAMAAIIGLEEDAVEAVCIECSDAGVCQIANDNGGGQIVISGARESIEKAVTAAGEKGAKRALLLPVSAPFHSELMQPAADAMRSALDDVTLNAPAVPLVANVVAAPIGDPDKIKQLLVEQVTGRVRWRETVSWFAANGVTELYEVGAGKVLTGLARRIDRSVAGKAINTPQDIEAYLGG
ncbi:ACP S-malonyltransferase [Hoeflea prorocentri]|uniref:Malonyl CoA-acyl carrier protein transacylase n=1 Tax=Hoeflea prorocentri TaxID=1922333 RepID=A0A9X3UHG1_9HYPH|nr:ACP S-malonyltransferase [Hoeflea prorocentri]MCY6381407.1 ACP S-malonyltransferase [Hoeflea prorocentri]MDA5399207.1 ACP S-malonyltransferase [Hoeflea prorocentri]